MRSRQKLRGLGLDAARSSPHVCNEDLAELGVLPHVVERLLNHRLGAISNRTQSIVTELAEIYNLGIIPSPDA